MRDQILKIYAFLLLAVAAYLLVLFVFQCKDIYTSWYAWASPNIDLQAYSVLALFYSLAVGTPVILATNSVFLLRSKKLKWYFAVIMCAFLLLSTLIGKLLLLISVLVYVYCRIERNHLTSVVT